MQALESLTETQVGHHFTTHRLCCVTPTAGCAESWIARVGLGGRSSVGGTDTADAERKTRDEQAAHAKASLLV